MKKTSTLVFIILCLFPALLSAQCFVGATCLQDTLNIGVTTISNPSYWNEQRFWYPDHESHDIPEGPADIRLRLLDTCAAADLAFVLYLNVKGDSTLAVVADSDSTYSNGFVRFTPAFGGEEVRFETRPVPDSQRYRFKLQLVYTQDTLEARLRFNTAQNPNQYSLPQLPLGTHKIYWFSKDSAGVRDTLCVQTIILKDTKAPVIVCLQNLPVNVQAVIPFVQTSLLNSDFLQYTEDNISFYTSMRLSVIREAGSTGVFPVDSLGNALQEVFFNCADVGSAVPVQLWAQDKAGNAAFCTTTITVGDNNGYCIAPPFGALCFETMTGQPVPWVPIKVSGTTTQTPLLNFTTLYAMQNGCALTPYQMINVYQNITLTPYDSTEYVNGVTSVDLLFISKHILGIEPISNTYKLIAADANKSGTITTADIVDLRRIILGVDTVLPNNSSWRFVRKNHVFPNPLNPFAFAFPEVFQSNTPIQDLYSSNSIGNPKMIAIKIGDLNNNAVPFAAPIPEDRNLYDSLSLLLPRTESGELVPIYFEKARLEGFQWSLQNVEPELLVPGPGLAEENFAWSAEHRTLRCSWISPDGAAQDFDVSRPVCWVKLKNAPEGLEPDFISEAYEVGALRRSIRIEKTEPLSLAPTQVVVAPNPTSGSAWVQGHLEQAGAWSFQVMDAQGRLLGERDGNTSDNALYLQIPTTALETAGLYFWVFSAGKTVQTGQLIKN